MSLRIGQKVFVHGIEWEVVGGRGPVYRVTHKCSRWIPEPTADGVTIRTVTIRLNSHRKINAES